MTKDDMHGYLLDWRREGEFECDKHLCGRSIFTCQDKIMHLLIDLIGKGEWND